MQHASSIIGLRGLVRPLNISRSYAVSRCAQSKLKITDGVEFDTIAREWRMKWSTDNDKKSLADVQKSLDKLLPAIKGIDGLASVQRVVCGGCQDYKVNQISLSTSFNPFVHRVTSTLKQIQSGCYRTTCR
jgi:hypothetical protein